MHESSADARCRNCNAGLAGPFCHACGQKVESTHLHWRAVVHEVTHEFLHLDGRVFRTLKYLITKPGLLTKELVEGRRASYITPLRLYLTLSLLYFLLVSALPGGGASLITYRRTEPSSPGTTFSVEATKPAEDLSPLDERQRQEIAERLFSNASRTVFVLMPFAALLTFAVYRASQPYFVAHLYYAVHLHAFVFLVATLGLLLSRGGSVGRAVAIVPLVWIFPYHFLAQRRFFGESWGRVAWKGALVTTLYLVALAGVIVLLVQSVLRTVLGASLN